MRERRKRIPAHIPVDVIVIDRLGQKKAPRAASVVDVSARGIGLSHGGLNADAGDTVCLRFQTLADPPLIVRGWVRWWSFDKVGIELRRLQPSVMYRYARLVKDTVELGDLRSALSVA